MRNHSKKKKALLVSLCLLLIWSAMATNTTLAWFTDTTPVTRNQFVIGRLDVEVSFKNDLVTDYTLMNEDTAIFNDKALYEPNYTQVVYLKVDNMGDMAFDYRLAVDSYTYIDSINVYGDRLHLPYYLKFGVLFGGEEAQLEREVAQALANEDRASVIQQFQMLNSYTNTDPVTVQPGESRYVAIIIYMPASVGDEANHRTGEVQPKVELGVSVLAQQAGTPMK